MVFKGTGQHQGRNALGESSEPKTTASLALQHRERDGHVGRDGHSKLAETTLEKHVN